MASGEEALIEVTNLLGQSLLRQTVIAGNATALDLGNLPDGSYLVRVSFAGEVIVQKLQLQR